MIDILDIKPNVVSRDLRGYTVLFYGSPKSGKTTNAAKFPKSLLLATEVGYLAIPGIKVAPIQKWSEIKQIIKQLKTEEAHQAYETIIIDTCDLAYELCEKYICAREGVESVGDIPYGQGWTKAKKEFDEVLRAFPALGYGLVLISHSQDKTFTDEDGKEYNKIVPTLSNGPRLIVERMTDIFGFASPYQNEDGTTGVRLYMRGTPRYEAGSRFKYITDNIEFDYDELVKAVGDAVDKEAKMHDNKFVTDEVINEYDENNTLDYNEIMKEFSEIVAKLQKGSKKEFSEKWAPFIVSLTDKYLGKGKKINDSTPEQVEMVSLVLSDLKDAINKA